MDHFQIKYQIVNKFRESIISLRKYFSKNHLFILALRQILEKASLESILELIQRYLLYRKVLIYSSQRKYYIVNKVKKSK